MSCIWEGLKGEKGKEKWCYNLNNNNKKKEMGSKIFTYQEEKGKCTLEVRSQMSTQADITMGSAHWAEKEVIQQMNQCHEMGIGSSRIVFLTQML